MGKFVIFILTLAVVTLSSATRESYRAYSSCSVSGDTDWAKAKPYKLKSWLGSVVPGMRYRQIFGFPHDADCR